MVALTNRRRPARSGHRQAPPPTGTPRVRKSDARERNGGWSSPVRVAIRFATTASALDVETKKLQCVDEVLRRGIDVDCGRRIDEI